MRRQTRMDLQAFGARMRGGLHSEFEVLFGLAALLQSNGYDVRLFARSFRANADDGIEFTRDGKEYSFYPCTETRDTLDNVPQEYHDIFLSALAMIRRKNERSSRST